jgi:PPOX class probable F420-dependent enzyme
MSEPASGPGPQPVDLEPVRKMVAGDHGLATVAVVRAEGTPHVSVVNAGVLDHPRTGSPVAAYVTYGKVKLRALRLRPATSLTWRVGWRWIAVDGDAEIIGPDETDPESLRMLLRDVFTACGGTHDDWDTYDRVMREEGRVAVFVTPRRVYGTG